MSNKKAPAGTGAHQCITRTDSATKGKRVKHPPADQPTPEAARLTGDPLDFTHFKRGDAVKYFLGASWSKGTVIAVCHQHCVHLITSSGPDAVHDARNLMTADQAKEHRLHKQRFSALCIRREKQREKQRNNTSTPLA